MLADFRYALRQLAKTPGFTAVALLTLALGIGANTAIFSVVQSVLLRPLPYPEPTQLLILWENETHFEQASIAWPDLQDWKRDNHAFTAIGGYRREEYAMTGRGEPEVLRGAQVDAAFFRAVGLPALLGRVFSEAEDKVGAPPIAVLGYGLWQQRFGGQANILGQTITLNGELYTIGGVMPADFATPARVDFWTQLGRLGDTAAWQDRSNHPGIYAIGRLKPGVTVAAGFADLNAVAQRLARDYPHSNTGVVAAGQSLFDATVGDYRRGLWTLLGAVALVLLIACANLAGLLIARSATRQTELAVRAALGASRARIVRQLFTESLLLALAGGALGVLLASWARTGIIALSPATVTRFREVAIDGHVLAVTCGLALVTALVFGLWPAWGAATPDLRTGLTNGGRTGSARGSRARSGLIVAELALTLTLLVGAGLLLRSFARMQTADLGFNADRVLTARLALPDQKYPTREKRRQFADQLLARLRNTPGIEAADFATNSPLNTGWQTSYHVPGTPEPGPGENPLAEMNVVTDTYFQTLAIPVLRGRAFSALDGVNDQPVVIIDEAFARRVWPDRDAVGQQLEIGGHKSSALIVGVVPTLKVYGYATEPKLPQAYLPARLNAPKDLIVLLRSRLGDQALTAALRAAVASVDPDQPLWDIRPMKDRIDATFASARLYTFLLAIFAGVALLLSAIGLYGVLAYQVSLRTREFGIRMAIGALPSHVTALVLSRGLRLLGLGLGLGLLGSVAVGRILSSLLYQTPPFDLGVLGSVTALLALTAIAASLVPARRAALVEPVVALRAE